MTDKAKFFLLDLGVGHGLLSLGIGVHHLRQDLFDLLGNHAVVAAF
jgi:hypothetical protein